MRWPHQLPWASPQQTEPIFKLSFQRKYLIPTSLLIWQLTAPSLKLSRRLDGFRGVFWLQSIIKHIPHRELMDSWSRFDGKIESLISARALGIAQARSSDPGPAMLRGCQTSANLWNFSQLCSRQREIHNYRKTLSEKNCSLPHSHWASQSWKPSSHFWSFCQAQVQDPAPQHSSPNQVQIKRKIKKLWTLQANL